MVVFPVVNTAQKSILGVSGVFIVLPCVAVALRLYGRHLKGVSLDISDYLIMGGLVRSLVSVLNCGVGHHMAEVIQEHGTGPVMLFMKELVAIQILWAVGNSCVKLSLLSFYCRVFSFPCFILMAKAIATFILLWALAITGALNLITDLIVLTMPMPYLWKLEMRPSQKLPLIAVFAIGLFVCIATIMRLVSLSLLDFTDLTSNITEAMIWGTIEPALGITLACVPFMKPVFPFTRSLARYTQYSRSESSGARDPGRKIFRHPHDLYPIQTLVSATRMEQTARELSPSISVDGPSDQESLVSKAFSEHAGGMSIVVQREFHMTQVSSTSP
ncbi:hypothetical protein BDV06DRAFT_215183 [Aspergillus oleicola]